MSNAIWAAIALTWILLGYSAWQGDRTRRALKRTYATPCPWCGHPRDPGPTS